MRDNIDLRIRRYDRNVQLLETARQNVLKSSRLLKPQEARLWVTLLSCIAEFAEKAREEREK
jgi:hypothetical protein